MPNPVDIDQLAWDSAALAFATQFRLPLTNKVGGYGEITIQRGEGDQRHLWAVTDGAFTGIQAWTEPDGWRYISDIGRAAAYRHTLRDAFDLARRAVEVESACWEAQINALRAEDS